MRLHKCTFRFAMAAGVLVAGIVGRGDAEDRQAPKARTVEVVASGVSFNPAVVTIEVGDTVRWTNLANAMAHNVAQTDNAGSITYNGGLFSGAPGAVPSFQHTFTLPGTFYYICTQHIGFGMRGRVVIADPAVTPTPTPTPAPSATPTPTPSPTAAPNADRILDYLLGLAADPSGLDVNGDNAVDVADLLTLLQRGP